MGEPITYNQQDIQRYLQKKMSAQEMHAFEKALMGDPFLADALEGYATANTAVAAKHLVEIEKKIRGEKEDAKVVAMPANKVQWSRIAAIFLVVMSGSVLTYYFFNTKSIENNSVKEMAAAGNSLPNAVSQDSFQPQEPALAKNDLSKSELLQKSDTRNTPLQENENRITETGKPAENVTTKAESSDIAANDRMPKEYKQNATASSAGAALAMKDEEATTAKNMNLPSPTQNEFKGKVTDDKGEPVPFASIRSTNGNVATSTDDKGNFSIKATDSVLKVDVSSVGYDVAKAELKNKTTSNTITLKENTQALSEVVVTGLATRKKTAYTAAATKVDGDKKNHPSNAEPEGGWQNFKQYVNRQIDSLQIDSHDLANDNIELEFSIDSNGRASDIKVTEKAKREVSEKAVQIIKNGPKWTKKSTDTKVKLNIPF